MVVGGGDAAFFFYLGECWIIWIRVRMGGMLEYFRASVVGRVVLGFFLFEVTVRGAYFVLCFYSSFIFL